MFGSTILDTAIAVCFVYLLLSLIVSAGGELISALLNWRATTLEAGIRVLFVENKGTAGNWAEKLFAHPLVDGLSAPGRKTPSYIPSRTFALALLDLIAPAKADGRRTTADLQAGLALLPDSLQTTLRSLLDEAGHDVESFKTEVEVWFNNGMERVSGWYKRKTQAVHFLLAIVLVSTFNIDSLRLVSGLSGVNSPLRASLVAEAQKFATDNKSVPTSDNPAQRLQKLTETLGGLGLPIGWSEHPENDFHFTTVLGWLLSALAASLGAPFWFDLLNRFINIRGTGQAPEEKPKKPKELPQPVQPGAKP